MLGRVKFPLTTSQISNFFLEKEYTNFLTLQQVISELIDTALVESTSSVNRTHLTLTPAGQETLKFFNGRISDAIRDDIHAFLTENEYALREEVSVQGNYYKSTSGEYEAHLVASPFLPKKSPSKSATTGSKKAARFMKVSLNNYSKKEFA